MKIEERLCCSCTCHGNVLRMVDVDPLILKFDARGVLLFQPWPFYRGRKSLPYPWNMTLGGSQNSLPILPKCGTQFWRSNSPTDHRTCNTSHNTPVFFMSRALADKGLALCTFSSTSIDSTIFCMSRVILFKSSYLA